MQLEQAAVPRVNHAATSTTRTAWLFWTSIAAIAVLPILFSYRFLSEPLGRDQAVYFTVVRSGTLPYLEVFDHKPPVIYGWYALADFVGGQANAIEVVNLLGAVQLSASALLVAWIGYLVAGRKLAVVAGFFMALFALNRYLQFDANTEVFMLPPLLAAIGLSIVGIQRQEARWFVLAGVLGGLATMTKTVAFLNVTAIAGVLLWASCVGQLGWRESLRCSGALIAGASAVLLATALPFVMGGAFDEFWHANVTYNVDYNAQVPFILKMFRFSQIDGRLVAASLPIWLLGCVGLVLACRTLPSTPMAITFGSAIAAFFGAILTGQQFPHYFVALTPFAALFAGITILEITRGASSSFRQRRHVEALLLVLAVPAFFAVLVVYVLPVDDAYEISHPGIDGQRAGRNVAIARYISSETSAEDDMYVFGREPQLYVLTRGSPAAYYVWGGAFDTQPSTFDDTLTALERDPPPLIIDTTTISEEELDDVGLQGNGNELDDDQRARLEAFLDQTYTFDRQIEHAKIYRLR
jgi:4-amino-4-deoxy-L-arabinose transferase-like glycosyltransferase